MKNPNDYIIDLAEKLYINKLDKSVNTTDPFCKELAKICRKQAEFFVKEIEFYFNGRSRNER